MGKTLRRRQNNALEVLIKTICVRENNVNVEEINSKLHHKVINADIFVN